MAQETDWINIRALLLQRVGFSWGGSEPRGPDLTLVAGFLWLHVGSRLWGQGGEQETREEAAVRSRRERMEPGPEKAVEVEESLGPPTGFGDRLDEGREREVKGNSKVFGLSY